MALNVVLVEPEIPQNTGNVARTCAATGARLHLVHPLGYAITDAKLRRAGMDYWYQVEISHHDNLDDLFRALGKDPVWLADTLAPRLHTQAVYTENCWILFGKESAGLPKDLLAKNLGRLVRIPMLPDRRSLNLSSAVAVVVYEALRQLGFPGLRGWEGETSRF